VQHFNHKKVEHYYYRFELILIAVSFYLQKTTI